MSDPGAHWVSPPGGASSIVDDGSRQPSLLGVWLGIAIMVASVIGAIVWMVSSYQTIVNRVDSLPRLSVPGQASVTLTPGTFQIFAEYQNANFDPLSSGTIGAITITDSNNRPVPMYAPTVTTTYSFGGHSGRSIEEFIVDHTDTYQISAEAGSFRVPVGLAVAERGTVDATSVGKKFLAPIGVGALGLLIGVAVLVVTLVRRSRWRAAHQPPMWGPGSGYQPVGYQPTSYVPPGYTAPGWGPPGSAQGWGPPGSAPGWGAPGPAQPWAPPPGAAAPWAPPPGAGTAPGSGRPPWESTPPPPSPAPPSAAPPPGQAPARFPPPGAGPFPPPGAGQFPPPESTAAPFPPPERGDDDAAAWSAPPPTGPTSDTDDATGTPGSAGLGDGPSAGTAGMDSPSGAGLGGAGVGSSDPGPRDEPSRADEGSDDRRPSTPGGAGLGGSALPGGGGLGGPPRRGVGPGGLLPGWDVPPATGPAPQSPEEPPAAADDDSTGGDDGEPR